MLQPGTALAMSANVFRIDEVVRSAATSILFMHR
jgi:hypothetical protein